MANEEKPAEDVSPTASDQPAQPATDSGTVQAAPEKPALPENTLFRGDDTPRATRVITGEVTKQGESK